MNTVIADDRCRVKLPEGCAPGDRFDVSKDRQGRVIYRKLDAVSRGVENVPLAHFRKGKNGLPLIVLPKGVKVTSEMVARVGREERDSR